MNRNNASRIATTAFIAADVDLADDTWVGPGAAIYGPTRIDARVRIDANVTIAAPLAASDAGRDGSPERCEIGADVVIGAGAVIYPGVRISPGAVIAPATLVQRNVPPLARVSGNPAIITGYRNTPSLPTRSILPDQTGAQAPDIPQSVGTVDTGVGGTTIHRLPHVRDLRGDLSVGEFDTALPFVPLRYFLVFDVPSESTRGEHAHKACHQFLVCTAGRCALIADDGERRVEIMLDRPTLGVHVPPGVWGIQYKYSPGAVLLVFASHHYDAGDYIRDYAEFLSYRQSLAQAGK